MRSSREVAGLKNLINTLIVLTFSAACGQQAAAEPTVTLKLGHAVETLMPLHMGAEKMAEIAAQLSGGSLKIEIFPGAQLGGEKDLTEGTQIGSIDMSLVSSGTLGRFAPMQLVAYAPYLFRDMDHFMKVYHGPIGEEMGKQLLDKTGIRALDLGWYYGVRDLTTKNTPVKVPADAKGLKIRAPNIPVMRDAIAAWGVSVTAMDPSEIYTALQTGVVDGQENPPSSIYGWKLYEVQKYLMLTGHMMGNMVVLINDKTWQKLSPEHRKALTTAVRQAGVYQSDLTLKMDQENINKLQKAGMIVVQPQVEEFRKLSASIIPKYEKEWGEGLFNRIRDTK
jgi:TRAP-type transport system periplasmic protein